VPTKLEDPPKFDELEISIIGPGKGESIAIHLGVGDWCLVDSCIARNSQMPAAFDYLKRFNNNALEKVHLILATHWHDDHIRGLRKLLEVAPNAYFACSMAISSQQFLELVSLSNSAVPVDSGVREFGDILELVRKRKNDPNALKNHIHSPIFATSNRRLLYLNNAKRSVTASVDALSPSDETLILALEQIAKLVPQPQTRPKRLPSQDANHTCVVLWIKVGERNVLLGADLENTNHPGDGWNAVLATHQHDAPAEVFKVAHHGSPNGDSDDVWQRLLGNDPVSVVTPYSSGKGLPQPSDLKRLCKRTQQLYCTLEGTGKPPARDSVVERESNRMSKNRRVLQGLPGQVRIRWSLTQLHEKPRVETFNGAYHVNKRFQGKR
jgi:hypothetical protein